MCFSFKPWKLIPFNIDETKVCYKQCIHDKIEYYNKVWNSVIQLLQVRLSPSLLYKFSYKTPWLSLLQWKSLVYMYFIALTPEKQLSFMYIHLYAHIPLFNRASNISSYAERLSYSAKLAGPSQVQFYPLIRRRIQSAKRISFFSNIILVFFCWW